MRYAPGRPFPPYAFLPGRDPHPVRDPAGHSFGREGGAPAYAPPERWQLGADYLHGVDLYNHAYFWEAHEAWEGLWHASKRDALQAEFLQGLIQCSAACLKISMEQPSGLVKLAELGTTKLLHVGAIGGPIYMGLAVLDFARAFDAFARSSPASISARPLMILAAR